jgi:ribosome-binding factor A
MLAGDRAERVGDQILREISDLLLKKVKDPRLKGVTITEVRLSRDLRNGTVYYSLFAEGEDREHAQKGFESAQGFIRKEIGERLRLRYVPKIQFKYDSSLEYGQRIERLLDKLVPR